ncbi:TonB-dependent receptor plug domain-containing protein [Pseudoxanthomonas indica]|uniref:TonB dependent receptor n=1 Tax=Pseudoxanthomonas indica TaxID=428993 RepID=A0A1T5KCJ3_9GAMM|nr:TonB-dependent receptor [Pseudoxanthomonas indica]GGD48353.1 membrane protein [Pseudoxanthomonas indica]SKC61229.1 TonB dependent receptor [Pseudoxanthomonas indica]
MSNRYHVLQHRRLAAAILVGLSAPGLAFAGSMTDAESRTQEAPSDTPVANAAEAAPAKTLDKVEVTGSRIKRADMEGPSPVVVISAEDIRKQGYSTISEALQTLTQFNGDVVAGEWNADSSQPDASFLNLRGLGVGYQLILLNGKRMTEYAASSGAASTGVSVGSIPAAAVERIEVLNGGASAIYGSDAVAGVVNIVTKDNWEGQHLRIRGGGTTRGGGDTGQIQLSGGKAWDRGSLTYAFEQLNREPILSGQRGNIIRTGMNAPGNVGTNKPTFGLDTALMDGGYNANYWMNQAGQLIYAADTDPDTAADALAYSCYNADPQYFPMYWSADDDLPAACGNANYYDGDTLANKYNKTSGYVAARYWFNDNIEGYGQALVQYSKSEAAHRTSMYLYNAGSAYDVNIGQFEYWRALNPNTMGGAPMRIWEESTISANVGVRGTLGNRFDWDASLSISRDEMKSRWKQLLTDRVHHFLFGEPVGSVDGSPLYEIDPAVLFGPVGPEQYASMVDTIRNKNLSQTSQAQVVFSGPLFSLPAGEVQMAAVAEASHSKYELRPDARSVSTYEGADRTFNHTGVIGGGPRDRYGVGVELRIPVFSRLTANVAGRWDKYNDISDVDDATTWQASLEWRPTDNLLIRASHQTSFMAPNIMWLYGEPVTNYDDYITNEYLCRVNGLDLSTTAGMSQCGSQYTQGAWYVEGGNNTRLHEETATSNGLGVVWDITDNLSISADYWDIDLKGKSQYLDKATLLSANSDCLLGARIDGTPVDPNSAACALYASYVQRDAEGNVTEYFLDAINQAGVRTKGYDASLRYAWATEALGNFSLNAGMSRTLDYDVKVTNGDPWEDYMPCSYSSTYSCGSQPVAFRTRTNWTLSWNRGAWAGSLYGYRNGARVNYQATDHLASYVQWNANLSKQLTDKLRLGVDVTNLLDEYGPKDETMTWYPFYQNIYGIQGRAIYVNLDITF